MIVPFIPVDPVISTGPQPIFILFTIGKVPDVSVETVAELTLTAKSLTLYPTASFDADVIAEDATVVNVLTTVVPDTFTTNPIAGVAKSYEQLISLLFVLSEIDAILGKPEVDRTGS